MLIKKKKATDKVINYSLVVHCVTQFKITVYLKSLLGCHSESLESNYSANLLFLLENQHFSDNKMPMKETKKKK